MPNTATKMTAHIQKMYACRSNICCAIGAGYRYDAGTGVTTGVAGGAPKNVSLVRNV
jgi:hypothetical protein